MKGTKMRTLFVKPILDGLDLESPSRYSNPIVSGMYVILHDEKWDEKIKFRMPILFWFLRLFFHLEVKCLLDIKEQELLANGFPSCLYSDAISYIKYPEYLQNIECSKIAYLAKRWSMKYDDDEFLFWGYNPWVYVFKLR